MTTTGNALVAFDPDGDTLRVRDTVMETSCVFTADDDIDPYRVSTDRFLFPVDAAVSLETRSLDLPANAGVYVRSEGGDIEVPTHGATTEYQRGTYYIEIDSACKLYVKVFDAAVEVRIESYNARGAATVEFDGRARVAVGARSLHERPAATITVPDDPGALREALPYLASGVKEWSCERSWSTLRGHPPRIERGVALDIPAHLSRPDTGVTIAVPETYEALYTVTPLAYYLGADVVPGDTPEIRLDNGFVEPLGDRSSLAERVRRLLSRCLFLDSLVRGEGYTSLPRQEYEAVAGELPFYPPELYDRPIADQLLEYLEVDGTALEGYLERWPYDAVLRDDYRDVSLLPSLLHELTPVRVDTSADGPTAICTGYSDGPIPEGATKLSTAGFEHSLSKPPRPASDARVALLGVGRDATDALSAVVTGTEGCEEREPFEVRVAAPTRANVREALTDDYDFVHVGAPVTQAGIECDDGVLDPEVLDGFAARGVSVVGPLDVAGPVADSFVEHGARTVLAASSLASRTVGLLVGRVLSGAPFAKTVAWSDLDESDASYRLAGDAASVVVAREGASMAVQYDIDSLAADDHRLATTQWWSPHGRPGGIGTLESQFVDDRYQLLGQTVEQPGALSSGDVVDLVAERGGIYVLNGDVYQHEDEMTADEVRDSARRALVSAESRAAAEELDDREA